MVLHTLQLRLLSDTLFSVVPVPFSPHAKTTISSTKSQKSQYLLFGLGPSVYGNI